MEATATKVLNFPKQKPKREHLTNRWYALEPIEPHLRLWNSPARFRVAVGGRRSGKSERAKRFLAMKACACLIPGGGFFFAGAPTRDQAKRIYWADLKALVPDIFIDFISESNLEIHLITGTIIAVVGLDKPQRIEGIAVDGCILDEYADMKPEVWPHHVRPALSTKGRPGWCWFVGVPGGQNHFYDLFLKAQEESETEWEAFHWKSSELLDPEEIESASRDLDPLSFQQEYEADWVNFQGKIYYTFDRKVHTKERIHYNPDRALILCFDFNVDPGVCVVAQEHIYMGPRDNVATNFTAVIDEIHIPHNSNTYRVCTEIASRWGNKHKGNVLLYGDATGGARNTAANDGNDWQIIQKELQVAFAGKVTKKVPKANPTERGRVNALNTRLLNSEGIARVLIDPVNCPHLIRDFEAVVAKSDGSGEIDKKATPKNTHLTDAFGYYIHRKWPIHQPKATSTAVA